MLLTGLEFNRQYKHKIFYKLTSESENHNSFQFRTGLNIDTIMFNPTGKCQRGGLYFTDEENQPEWLDYKYEPMIYIRLVRIPNEARVWIERNGYKADQLILEEKVKIEELVIWSDEIGDLVR